MSRKKPFREQRTTQDNTGENTFQDSLVSVVSRLKELGNVSVIIAGLAYGCGFLITNLHLNTYGIYDFSIINARYIYTGAMFLLLCFMAYVSASRIMKRAAKSQTLWGKILSALFLWGFESSILSLSLKSLLLVVDGFEGFARFPITFWFYIAIPTFGVQIWFMNRNNAEEYSNIYPTTSLVTIIVVAAIYALSYYSLLPTSLGGGRPTPIQFIIKDENVNLVNQFLSIKQGNKTDVVYMIEQGGDSYYVLAKNAGSQEFNPIQINKSLVVGVFHPLVVGAPPFLTMSVPSPTSIVTPMTTSTP